MSDLAFQQMLAVHNQEFKDSEEFGSDWMPPDREDYICTGIKCTHGTSSKKDPDKPMGWWKPVLRIEEPSNPDLNGKEFPLGFFSTNTLGLMKGQARAINGGDPVADLTAAHKVFTELLIGRVFKVRVTRTVSTKNGKEYTNAYVQEVLATTTVDVEPEEPPQVAEFADLLPPLSEVPDTENV